MTDRSDLIYKHPPKPTRRRRWGQTKSIGPYRRAEHSGAPPVIKLIRTVPSTPSDHVQQSGMAVRWRIAFAAMAPLRKSGLRDAIQSRNGWHAMTATGLLHRISDPLATQRDRETAILFAETTAFDDSLREPLLRELGKFITKNRFTRDPDRITVVGSAVRKYAMNMDESHFESYVKWLRPTQTEALPCQVELELVKGVCWRLSYRPLSGSTKFPFLESALADIANAYLQFHLILQENYASIALQTILAIAVLQALSGERDKIGPMLQRATSLGLNWFSEVLDDRLEETWDAISEHDPRLAERFRELVDACGRSRAQHAGG